MARYLYTYVVGVHFFSNGLLSVSFMSSLRMTQLRRNLGDCAKAGTHSVYSNSSSLSPSVCGLVSLTGLLGILSTRLFPLPAEARDVALALPAAPPTAAEVAGAGDEDMRSTRFLGRKPSLAVDVSWAVSSLRVFKHPSRVLKARTHVNLARLRLLRCCCCWWRRRACPRWAGATSNVDRCACAERLGVVHVLVGVCG